MEPQHPITHVRSAALAVADIDASTTFYCDMWQLELLDRDGDLRYFGSACSESHILRLRASSQPRIDLVTFAVRDREGVDWLTERVGHFDGGEVVREPRDQAERGGGYASRCFDVDGRLIEFSTEVEGRPFYELEPGESRPRKISHVVFNTPDIERTRRWYEDVLGFRVSDWVEDFFCFLRTGRDHHLLAFSRSDHASLNHVSFELRGLDEFMRGTGRLMRAGMQPIWGPGRHGAGDNTFSYFREPTTGFVMEYTTALQEIDDEHGWTPKRWGTSPQETDQWGTSNPFDETVLKALQGYEDPGLWTPPPA